MLSQDHRRDPVSVFVVKVAALEFLKRVTRNTRKIFIIVRNFVAAS
jgi:hypothetical protein